MSTAKKTNTRVIPAGKTQENFNIESGLLEKVKDLVHATNTSRAEVYHAALEKYIELYEKKNGKIKPRPKGKGLDL